MSENLKKYLKMQISLNKLSKEQVLEKYPEMEKYLDTNE